MKDSSFYGDKNLAEGLSIAAKTLEDTMSMTRKCMFFGGH